MPQCQQRIVVFDLDETLGYFTEFGMLWEALKNYIKNMKLNVPITQLLFDNLLDLYPEFIRPCILNVLLMLIKKKKEQKCSKILIYTNNQGEPEWAKFIVKYFENKLGTNFIDQTIGAFKINNVRYEPHRTSHNKTHTDLLNCSKFDDDALICMIDDVLHPGMHSENTYYIHIKPYIYNINFDTMIERLLDSHIFIASHSQHFKNKLLSYLNKYSFIVEPKTLICYNDDIEIGAKLLLQLQAFFNLKHRKHKKTIKNHNGRKHLQTRKIHK